MSLKAPVTLDDLALVQRVLEILLAQDDLVLYLRSALPAAGLDPAEVERSLSALAGLVERPAVVHVGELA